MIAYNKKQLRIYKQPYLVFYSFNYLLCILSKYNSNRYDNDDDGDIMFHFSYNFLTFC